MGASPPTCSFWRPCRPDSVDVLAAVLDAVLKNHQPRGRDALFRITWSSRRRHGSGRHLGRPRCSIHWRGTSTSEPLDRSTADLTFRRTGWMTRLHRAQPRTEAEGAPGGSGPPSPRAIRSSPPPAASWTATSPAPTSAAATSSAATTSHDKPHVRGLHESPCPRSTSPKIALPPLKLDYQSLFRDPDKLNTQLLGQLEPTFIVI